MHIKNLKLTNFRNYKSEYIEFSPGKNIIYGLNGQGKTNIVEAIYFLQSGKSYRSLKDSETIMFGEDYAKIEIEFEKNSSSQSAQFFISDKKSVKLNGILLDKLSELVGNINIVIFTPDHLNLIKDGPGIRRQFLDSFISQLKPTYFKNLINYYRVLKQRNNLLKQRNRKLLDTVFVWDEKLSQYGAEICKMRMGAIEKINSTVNMITSSGEVENIELKYIPSIKGDFTDAENFVKQLNSGLEKDFERGITQTGPHKDDFSILMNGFNIKKYGSQGQQRSCVLKLKLSECEIIKEKEGEQPVLLLDDILSELDEERRRFFIENIKDRQVIITCTDMEYLSDLSKVCFEVEKGKIIRKQEM